MSLKRVVAPALLAILWLSLLGALAAGVAARSRDYEWFDPIIEVRSMLLRDFVEAPDEQRMQQAMLAAMVASLEDPHTVWVPPSEEDRFNKQLLGAYVGIGAEIDIQDRRLVIVTPLEDSPALEAGVMAGDVVLTIDGESTLDKSPLECAERIMGEEGTPVRLEVRHPDGREEELVVTRRRIVTRTVKGISRDGETWSHWLDPEAGIAYVRLTQFTDATAHDLAKVLEDLSASRESGGPGLRGLVLDLRFNGGGALAQAIAVSDLFLDEGRIVTVRGRAGESRSWSAGAGGVTDVPLVVLINDGSASASEIVAGALQDNGRARILGTRSYGKGSVQEVRQLPGAGGILKLTIARYELPGGRAIDRTKDSERWGVDPDPGFHVPMTIEQYRQMFEHRRRFEVIGAGAGAAPDLGADPPQADDAPRWGDPEWLRREIGDIQLAAALETLRSKAATGDWLAVGDDGGDEAVRREELAQASAARQRLREQLEAVERRIEELTQ